MIESIQDLYWGLIPYEYRPFQLWYRLKCLLWHRHTTVKPRYLGHTYCDTVSLLVHISFELLLKFIEDEADSIVWDSDDGHRHARNEMDSLAKWYREEFIPYDDYSNQAILHELQPEPVSITDRLGSYYRLNFESEDDELMYLAIHETIYEYELRIEQETSSNLKRLADIRPYLWT